MSQQTAAAKPPNKRRTSWAFRIVASLLATLILLYAVAVGVMSTEWFHRFLTQRVIMTIESATGARVEIGKLEFRPTILQATLHSLVLRGKEQPPEPPLFLGQTIVVGLNPLSILRRQVLIRRIDWQGGDIHIYTYADGSTNLPGPRVSLEKGQAIGDFLDLSIRRLNISHGNFFWNDRKVPLDLSARNLALLLSLGRDRRYVGSLSSSDTELRALGWKLPPVTFSTRIELSRSDFALPSFVFRCSGATGQGTFSLHRFPAAAADLAFQTNGDLRSLAQSVRLLYLEGGKFKWQGKVNYAAGEWSSRGRIEARQVLLKSSDLDLGDIDLSADYSANSRRVQLPNLAVKMLGGVTESQIDVTLRGSVPKFDLSTRVRGLDLASAVRSTREGRDLLAELPVTGHVSGSFDAGWSGALRNFQSRFDLAFEPSAESHAGGRPVSGTARGGMTLAPNVSVELESARLNTPHSELTATGELNGAHSSLTVQLQTSEFEEWRTVAETFAETSLPLVLDSPAKFSGWVTGTFSRPEIRGQLGLGAFEYRGSKWDKFDAAVIASRDLAQVSSAKLLAGPSALDFDVFVGLENWKFTAASPLRLSAQARRTPLEGLLNALEVAEPASGFVTGGLNLEGNRSNLTGSGAVRINNGTFHHEPFDLLTAQFRIAASVWDVESLRLTKDGGRLTGQARIDLNARSFSGRLQGFDFSLADVRWLGQAQHDDGSSTFGLQLGGQASFSVAGDGTFENARLQGTLDVRDLRTGGLSIGDWHSTLDYARRQLTAQGNLQGPGGAFDFKGSVRTEGDWPGQLTAETKNLRTDPWIRSLRLGRFGAAVTTSGKLSVDGPFRDPGRLGVHSTVEKLQVSFPGLSWENDRPVDVALSNRSLVISRFHLVGPSTRLEVDGSARLAKPASVSLRASGQIDAALLNALDPALLTTGRFNMEVRAAGTLARPSVFGRISIDNVSLGYPGIPFRLSGLNGDVRLEGDRLTITSLHGASSQNSVDLSGFVTLSENPHYDLRADLSQARIEYPIDFTSVLNGSLRTVGSTEGGLVTGEMTVAQMFVRENFNVVTWLSHVANEVPGQPAGAPLTFASKVRLDVHLTSAPVVTLESHDLRLVADVDMALRGTLANPVAFGNVHIQSGQAVLRGTTYALTRGDITMANLLKTQPALDLEARTRVQRYDLLLTVTGSADRPRISYRSDPPLPTPDILALLAFGYSTQQQVRSAGAGRSEFGTLGASALLSQALSSERSGRVQRFFGLSRVGIEPDPSGVSGTRVTVQEQITRDFTVTYITTTSGPQQRIVQVEWDLSDSVSLLGIRDQNGVYGVELDFRRRHK